MKKGHILKNGFVLKHKTKNGGLTKPHKTKKGKRVVLIKVCQWSSLKKPNRFRAKFQQIKRVVLLLFVAMAFYS